MKVSELINNLEEELTDIRQANLKLSKANEIFREENICLRTSVERNQEPELNRQITNLRIKQKELEKENKRLYQACHLNEVIKFILKGKANESK